MKTYASSELDKMTAALSYDRYPQKGSNEGPGSKVRAGERAWESVGEGRGADVSQDLAFADGNFWVREKEVVFGIVLVLKAQPRSRSGVFMKAFFASVLCLLLSFQVFADWNLERAKIEFLISSIEQSDAIFIRNSVEYSAKKAASHLRLKLKYVLSHADLETFTAEDFILQAASKSSLTGRPYLILFSDGQQVPAEEWLLQQLESFN